MEYKEVKRFRDGTVMIRVNGRVTIVDAELNSLLMQKNWPAVVAKRLQKQFPHMSIEYVEDEMPGISVTCANGITQAFCNWDGLDAPEAIYASCLNVINIAEQTAIDADQEYFTNHYIKINTYE